MAAVFKFLVFYNIVFLINSQDIFFEGSAKELDKCNITSGLTGNCKYAEDCPKLLNGKIGGHEMMLCGYSFDLIPLICCPAAATITGELIPKIGFECGMRGLVTLGASKGGGGGGALLRKIRALNRPTVIGGEESGFVSSNSSVRQTWPWMVLLGEGKISSRKFPQINFFCDGVLINERFILTAAHCLVEQKEFFVRLSEHNYDDFVDDGRFPEDIEVESVFEHPNYKWNLGYNDLALIKMAKNVSFTESIRPICLPWNKGSNSMDLVNKEVVVTGWGAEYYGGPLSSFLQEVNVTIFHPSACEDKYSSLSDYKSLFPQGMTVDNLLCAGDVLGGKDACQGDSGAPLIEQESDNGPYILTGIVSKGYGCGSKDFPGLYVPIRNQENLKWIKDIAFKS